MELIASLYDLKSYQLLKKYADGIVVYSNDFSSFYMNGLSKEEIKELIKLNNNERKLFLNLEFMLENSEIESITNFIKYFKDDSLYFLVADLGVAQILKEEGLGGRTIYNPNTLITNSYDLEFYSYCGLNGVVLSQEITLEDQVNMLENKKCSVFFQVFGYHLMFHSKRHLISLYSEFLNKNIKMDNYNQYLVEQTRDDKYHIYESNRGTLLFRPYISSYLDSLDKLQELDYAFVDNMFIDINTYSKVLEISRGAVDKKLSKEEILEKLNLLNLKIEDGFKYQDTVYQKEALK